MAPFSRKRCALQAGCLREKLTDQREGEGAVTEENKLVVVLNFLFGQKSTESDLFDFLLIRQLLRVTAWVKNEGSLFLFVLLRFLL